MSYSNPFHPRAYFVLACGALSLTALAVTTDTVAASPSYHLAVDGNAAGALDVTSAAITPSAFINHESIAAKIPPQLGFEVGASMSPKLASYLEDSVNHGFAPRDLAVYASGLDAPVDTATFRGAYLSGLTVPTLEANSKDPCSFALDVDPETIVYADKPAPKAAPAPKASKKWLCSNFKLEIDGLPTDRVAKIDSIKWTQKVVRDKQGKFAPPKNLHSGVQLPHLTLTINAADWDAWHAWHQSFLSDGADQSEKSGTLSFLGPDLQEELGSINFTHLGIISLEQEAPQANNDQIARFRVELYCESMFFDVLN